MSIAKKKRIMTLDLYGLVKTEILTGTIGTAQRRYQRGNQNP